MAKLTKAQRQTIELALSKALRVQAYINRPDVAVGYISDRATTTLHFERASDGKAFQSLAKDIGSDLAMLPDVSRLLLQLLTEGKP